MEYCRTPPGSEGSNGKQDALCAARALGWSRLSENGSGKEESRRGAQPDILCPNSERLQNEGNKNISHSVNREMGGSSGAGVAVFLCNGDSLMGQ